MRHVDIAVVGGGLAGSTAAAMLGRAGVDAVLIDPHTVYPLDFRCEKFDASQLALLHKTGLAGAVLRAATPDGEISIARFGRLVETRPNLQYGILYDRLVNTVRAEIPAGTPFIQAKATAIATGADRQELTLSNGETVSARLIVLANGLNIALRHALGIAREVVSECHSISIGFDVTPVGRPSFDFRALTYYPERAAERLAYVTFFPVAPGATLRANLFCYRDMHDPWLRSMRQAPHQTLLASLPGLDKLMGDFDVKGDVKIRPVDLTVSSGYRQAGIVLVGDAFATSCPAAGTGTNKVLTDVERLCNVHIPRWLASDGMGVEKVAAFYDDPVKQACDEHSSAKAYYLRSLSTDAGLAWTARRWGKFLGQLGVGKLRSARARLSLRPHGRPDEPAGDGGGTLAARRAAGE
jgi:2-polyprenyl-6-methoxyphenol hydroxylase-like FAD-dependent oxidoreductase